MSVPALSRRNPSQTPAKKLLMHALNKTHKIFSSPAQNPPRRAALAYPIREGASQATRKKKHILLPEVQSSGCYGNNTLAGIEFELIVSLP